MIAVNQKSFGGELISQETIFLYKYFSPNVWWRDFIVWSSFVLCLQNALWATCLCFRQHQTWIGDKAISANKINFSWTAKYCIWYNLVVMCVWNLIDVGLNHFQKFLWHQTIPPNMFIALYKWTRHYFFSGIILCMRPANERRRYIVTSFLIGWTHIQNDPWFYLKSVMKSNWTKKLLCG